MLVERIPYDVDTVNPMIPKFDSFFVQVILPKVLCSEPESQKSADCSELFCLCRRGECGKIIACDSPQCEFRWFHYGCVGLPNDYEPGEDEWLCPECMKRTVHLPMHCES